MTSSGRPVQNGVDLSADFVDARHAVDAANEPLLLVEGQDRRRLGAIFLHAGAHRLLVVVGAALKFRRAANVTETLHLRRAESVVIAGAALRTGEAAGDARYEGFFVDGKFDDVIELAAAFPEQDLER